MSQLPEYIRDVHVLNCELILVSYLMTCLRQRRIAAPVDISRPGRTQTRECFCINFQTSYLRFPDNKRLSSAVLSENPISILLSDTMASVSISIIGRCHAASPASRHGLSAHNRSKISASTRPSRTSSLLARSSKKDHDEKAKEFAFREDHAGECDLSDARDVSSQQSAILLRVLYL